MQTIKSLKLKAMLLLTLASATMFYSCNQEEVTPSGPSIGFLNVSLGAIQAESLSGSNGRMPDLTPSLNLADFALIIYQKGTNNIIQQFGVGMIPTNSIELMDGDYTAVLNNHKDGDLTIGHFIGSQDFTIVPQQQTGIDVLVSLQEVYFMFTLLENFYTTHHITVENNSGLVVVADASNPYTEMYLPTLSAPETYLFSVINNTSGATIGTIVILADVMGNGYNLKVTQLTGSGAFSITIDPIIVVDDEFVLSPTVIVGFTGSFEGLNWISSANGSATSYAFSTSNLVFDCPSGGGGFVSEITILADGNISFDWNMVIRTAGQYGDSFSYLINGVAVTLTSAGGGSGSETAIAVSQGDVFKFSTWGTTQSSSYYGDVQNFVFTY
jgi:hypothetical protein